MFCSKCGSEIPDESVFCPRCGAGVAPAAQLPIQNAAYSGQAPAGMPAAQLPAGGFPAVPPRAFKALGVLSIIGIILGGLNIIPFLMVTGTVEQLLGLTGYALAHGIVALVQGHKHRRAVLKVMAIIGIIVYVLMFVGAASVYYDDYDLDTFTVLALISTGYLLTFTIVAFVQSRKKT